MNLTTAIITGSCLLALIITGFGLACWYEFAPQGQHAGDERDTVPGPAGPEPVRCGEGCTVDHSLVPRGHPLGHIPRPAGQHPYLLPDPADLGPNVLDGLPELPAGDSAPVLTAGWPAENLPGPAGMTAGVATAGHERSRAGEPDEGICGYRNGSGGACGLEPHPDGRHLMVHVAGEPATLAAPRRERSLTLLSPGRPGVGQNVRAGLWQPRHAATEDMPGAGTTSFQPVTTADLGTAGAGRPPADGNADSPAADLPGVASTRLASLSHTGELAGADSRVRTGGTAPGWLGATDQGLPGHQPEYSSGPAMVPAETAGQAWGPVETAGPEDLDRTVADPYAPLDRSWWCSWCGTRHQPGDTCRALADPEPGWRTPAALGGPRVPGLDEITARITIARSHARCDDTLTDLPAIRDGLDQAVESTIARFRQLYGHGADLAEQLLTAPLADVEAIAYAGGAR